MRASAQVPAGSRPSEADGRLLGNLATVTPARPLPQRRVGRLAATVLALAALAAVAAALTACGSGRYNVNFSERASIDSARDTIDGVELRNVIFSSPANQGQPALLIFSLYSRVTGDGEMLQSVSAPSLSRQPMQLQQVTAPGQQQDVSAIPVRLTTSTGSQQFAATLPSVGRALPPATYVDVTFTFAKRGPQVLQVPVRTIGAAPPGSTLVPGIVPDSPHPPASGLPGGLLTPSAGATAAGNG